MATGQGWWGQKRRHSLASKKGWRNRHGGAVLMRKMKRSDGKKAMERIKKYSVKDYKKCKSASEYSIDETDKIMEMEAEMGRNEFGEEPETGNEYSENPATVKLKGVKKVTVQRVEGPSYLVDKKPRTFKTVKDADNYLKQISASLNRDEQMGYDKTEVEVKFKDGSDYGFRADVEADGTDTDIARHIYDFLYFHTGSKSKRATEYQKTVSDDEKRRYKKWLDDYLIVR